MALSRKGTALAFGIGGLGLTAPTVTGISAVQSAEATDEFTVNTTARNAGGETVSQVVGDAKATLRVEGLHTAADLPALDSAITVAGRTGFVTRSTVTASNEDFVKISVEGEKYANVS